MNDVMTKEAVETQKKRILPLINTDDTDLQKLTADQRGLTRIK
jgi:hypothetical protein